MPPNAPLNAPFTNEAPRQKATRRNVRQNAEQHCNTLQHPATHYNTLQHTATMQSKLHDEGHGKKRALNKYEHIHAHKHTAAHMTHKAAVSPLPL